MHHSPAWLIPLLLLTPVAMPFAAATDQPPDLFIASLTAPDTAYDQRELEIVIVLGNAGGSVVPSDVRLEVWGAAGNGATPVTSVLVPTTGLAPGAELRVDLHDVVPESWHQRLEVTILADFREQSVENNIASHAIAILPSAALELLFVDVTGPREAAEIATGRQLLYFFVCNWSATPSAPVRIDTIVRARGPNSLGEAKGPTLHIDSIAGFDCGFAYREVDWPLIIGDFTLSARMMSENDGSLRDNDGSADGTRAPTLSPAGGIGTGVVVVLDPLASDG